MKTYNAHKGILLNYLLLTLLLILVVLLFVDLRALLARLLMVLPLLSPLSLGPILWAVTRYTIEVHTLFFRNGLRYGRIDIQEVEAIEQGKILYSWVYPAHSKSGLAIKCHKGSDLYLAPQSQQALINGLLQENLGIVVTHYRDKH